MSHRNAKTGLYPAVRAGFVEKDDSLAAWCRRNGITRQYAAKVLKGETNGKAARRLRARIIDQAFSTERGE